MRIIKDIVRKEEIIIIIGSKEEVLEKINNLKKREEKEKRDKKLLKTVNGIWGAFNLNEKLYILERSGYKLEN